ncbi:MAG TPA: MFS transporter, partial [Candidatus Caccoplasma intestinavium]|nr:MFS transporter [Candidatus Caccoplasma intestinavium]
MGIDMERKGEIVGDLDWDGLHRPRIYYAMVATFSGLFLAVLDGTICNVALPSISEDLQVSSSDSIWIINAFQLVIMMSLLPFSSLGELFGYKRIYLFGVAVFTVGSLFCSLTATLPLLVVARVFQGIGAAMIMSVNTSLVRIIYPKRHLGKGVGLNATVVAIASVAGPTLAAAILSVASWPWLFAINVPVGIITFYLGRKYLPANPTRVLGRRFKWKEALFNALTFGLLIGCIEAYSHDVSHTTILAGAVCLLFVGVQYVRMQLHDKYPMLPFDLLKIPAFSLSVVTSVLSFTSQMLAMVAMPFLLVNTFHYEAVGTGLLMTSWPLVIVFVAPMAGWLVGKVHPGILGGIGLTIMSAGCFLLAFVPVDTTPLGLVWRLMLCGMGFGFFQSPNNHMLLSSAPPHRTGSASGMLATARLLGQTTGAALVALLFHLFGDTAPHDAMLLAGVLTLCGAFSSVTRL